MLVLHGQPAAAAAAAGHGTMLAAGIPVSTAPLPTAAAAAAVLPWDVVGVGEGVAPLPRRPARAAAASAAGVAGIETPLLGMELRHGYMLPTDSCQRYSLHCCCCV